MSPVTGMIFGFLIQPGVNMEIVKMSRKEIRRAEIIAKTIKGKLSQREASREIGVSLRQIKRMVKRYKNEGIVGLIHRNRKKPSNKKIPLETRKHVRSILSDEYEGFGPQLAKEQLEVNYQLKFSREWLRQLMIEEGLWEVKKRRKLNYHQRRNRRSREGELIQIDGSYHDWLEGRGPKCCLIDFVDDATGKIVEARFVHHESTEDYFISMKRYLEKYGRPIAIYSDKHMIFKGLKNDSQFARALKELNVELITAHSPQAKGRVERAHKTLQDRLIKLMRLKQISSIEEANEFLKDFLQDYNSRFGRCPQKQEKAHSPYLKADLNKILCIKEKRKVSKSFSIQYDNKTYQLAKSEMKRRLVGKTVWIYQIEGRIQIELEGKELKYSIYEEMPYMKVMDRKRIDAFLDRKLPMTVVERTRRKSSVNF